MNKTESNIDNVFSLLDTWRNLPAYQLERRSDIFFAIHLPIIINKKFGINAEYIVPEFPVRIGTLYRDKQLTNPNLSFKIDYVVVSNTAKRIFLVELKTDNGSRREKQDWYLEKAKEIGLTSLINGILDIYRATNSKKKYSNLLNLLIEIGFLSKDYQIITANDYQIEIIYIQPDTDQPDKNILTFDNVASMLMNESDFLTKRFVESLLRWKTNPNS